MFTDPFLEASHLRALSNYLDSHYGDSPDYYRQKGNFEVSKLDDDWLISTEVSSFYPSCTLVDYLQHEHFKSVKIDDECNLIVTVPHPGEWLSDRNYVARCFDEALEWLPRYVRAMDAFKKYQEAKEVWEQAQEYLSCRSAA